MKNIEFKFSWGNMLAFLLLGGLFYGLCPLPENFTWRVIACSGVGVAFFIVCFVVVTHKSIIRQGRRTAAVNRSHKKRK